MSNMDEQDEAAVEATRLTGANGPTGVNIERGKFPAGTTAEDRVCWLCGGPTAYRQCKIVCSVCGFTRDCSDP